MTLYCQLITFEAFVKEEFIKMAIFECLIMLIDFFHNIDDKLFFLLTL